MNESNLALRIYKVLLKAFGPQHWWPGDTPLEIVVGAILTQNTSWTNVEKAIIALKAAGLLDAKRLKGVAIEKLAELIRPAGYFNVKARRLKNFFEWLEANYEGDLDKMFARGLSSLREELLEVRGVGPETADSILLYAGQKPSFVVDAYTYRVFSRHQLIPADTTYDEIKEFFESNLPADVQLYNEYHALLVALGKKYCKPRPLCAECPLGKEIGPGIISD
jgi:endonuclease-3 related protein